MCARPAVMPKFSVTLDAEGAHRLGGSLPFVSRDAGYYVEATRVINDPIAAAVLVPGERSRMEINDLKVSLTHSHAETFCDRVLWIKLIYIYIGELIPRARCSETKGRRIYFPWTTSCCSTKPTPGMLMHLSGKKPRSPGGGNT